MITAYRTAIDSVVPLRGSCTWPRGRARGRGRLRAPFSGLFDGTSDEVRFEQAGGCLAGGPVLGHGQASRASGRAGVDPAAHALPPQPFSQLFLTASRKRVFATIVPRCYHDRMSAKQRLSASVDTHLMAAAEQAVKRGRAKNLSAWVNDAMRLKVDHDRRLAALASFIEAYEAEYGEITAEEIRLAERNARARAVRPRVMAPAGSLVKRARGRS